MTQIEKAYKTLEPFIKEVFKNNDGSISREIEQALSEIIGGRHEPLVSLQRGGSEKMTDAIIEFAKLQWTDADNGVPLTAGEKQQIVEFMERTISGEPEAMLQHNYKEKIEVLRKYGLINVTTSEEKIRVFENWEQMKKQALLSN